MMKQADLSEPVHSVKRWINLLRLDSIFWHCEGHAFYRKNHKPSWKNA